VKATVAAATYTDAMSSKKSHQPARAKRTPARQRGQRPSQPQIGQQQPRIATAWKAFWKAVNANGVAAAVVAVVLTAVVTHFADPGRAIDAETIKTDQSTIKTDKGQLKADRAQVKAYQEQNAAATSHDADEVSYGLLPGPNSGGSQVWIMNESDGWIRDMTLVVPVTVKESRSPGGGISINFSNFSLYGPLGPGFTGETCTTTSGCTFRDPLLDLGPCMEAATTVLKSVPSLSGAAMEKSSLYFNDPNGISWVRTGNGPPVRNTTFQGSGVWTPYASQRRIPGCVVGG